MVADMVGLPLCSSGPGPLGHLLLIPLLHQNNDHLTRDPEPAMEQTPAASGYRMPAEWEPHEATWIAWPHERADWPGKFAPIPWIYGDIVRHLAAREKVRILIPDAA